jgi:hypothetical protein
MAKAVREERRVDAEARARHEVTVAVRTRGAVYDTAKVVLPVLFPRVL